MTAPTPAAGVAPVPVANPRMLRVRSWVLVVLGLALGLGMAFLVFSLAPSLLHPGQAVGGSTYTGTAAQAGQILVLLAGVCVLGLLFAIVGARQLATGRSSKLVYLAIVVTIAVAYMGWSATSTLS